MRRPNLLATRAGRLAAFTALYACEGIPQGFATGAVALELKRLGLDAAALGALLAAFLGPWAWKWAFGPIVDNLHLPGFGRRKPWIVGAQIGLIATLLLAITMFPTAQGGAIVGLGTYTTLLVLANLFGAVQDVAIDALAVSTLDEGEAGLANGFMFAGAMGGISVGGSGVLFLKGHVGFGAASLAPPALLAALCVATAVLVQEPVHEAPPGPRLARIVAELRAYGRDVFTAFFRTATGFLGVLLALLPFGGVALSLTLSSVITPSLGMTDDEIASLNLICSAVFMATCLFGGWVSDRLGRIPTAATFSLLTLVPTAWMAWKLSEAGWTVPSPAGPDGTWPRAEGLIAAWTVAQIAYTVPQGLMYGVRTAMFMSFVEPKIAATQFTAYMALLNVSTMISNTWEGKALSPVADGGWGLTFSQTLWLDCAIGALFVVVLPFVPRRRA